MKTKLRMKCPKCGHWNRIEVEKVLFNPRALLTQEEWEKRIEIKTLRAAGVKKYREIQFSSKP